MTLFCSLCQPLSVKGMQQKILKSYLNMSNQWPQDDYAIVLS